MEQAYQRMSITRAVESVQAEFKVSNYRLAKILGVESIMIKHYKDGNVKSVSTRVAYNLWSVYGILVDTFNSVEELEAAYKADK